MVLAKRLPADFGEKTLLPHLEHQILYQIMSWTPDRLVKLARAYMECVDYYQPNLTERTFKKQIHLKTFFLFVFLCVFYFNFNIFYFLDFLLFSI